MVKISITAPEAISASEFALCAAIVSTFNKYTTFIHESIPLLSSGFRCEKITQDGQAPDIKLNRQTFVEAVHKGMQASVTVEIDTPDGPDERTFPLLPVIFVDVPSFPDAMVFMTEEPHFEFKPYGDGIQMKFKNEFLDWVHTDINHEDSAIDDVDDNSEDNDYEEEDENYDED